MLAGNLFLLCEILFVAQQVVLTGFMKLGPDMYRLFLMWVAGNVASVQSTLRDQLTEKCENMKKCKTAAQDFDR